MGTSLSGLTPATTFDGLLKVGDNDPLTAELKAISTGDGTDTILQLSTTALQISGDTTIETTGTWVNGFNSNLRLESDAPSMQFKDTGGTPGFMIGVSGGSTIFYQSSSADFSSTNAVGRIFSGRWSFGVGTDLGASVGIKGSGASALTTSLLVQNSAGTQALKVTDDGELTLGDSGKGAKINLLRSIGGAQIGYIEGQSSGVMISMANNSNQILLSNNGIGIGETTPTARLHIKGSGNDNTTTSLLVQNSDGLDMLEVDDSGNVGIGDPNPLSATLHISSQSYFNNTTALRIQNSIGNNLFRIKGDGTTDIINNRYIFNQSGVSTGGAIFKGSGNDDTTTALLVQNSDGADLLKVNDNGATTIQSNLGVSGGDVAVFQNSVDPTNQFKINKRDDSTNIWYTGTTNSEIEYRDNIHFRFNFAGTTRMQLRNTGNLGLGVGSANASARMHIKGSGTDATTTALLVQNLAGTELFKVDDSGATDITANITNAVLGSFRNTDSNGFGIELRAGNGLSKYSMQWESYNGGGGGRLYPNGVMIGDQAAPTARLHIKGEAPSGDPLNNPTALLVESSAGTDLLQVLHSGQVSAAGYFSAGNSVLGSAYLRVRDTKLYPAASGTGINVQANATNNPPHATAVLQADSTTQGFLPPRMTETQRNAIANPVAVGLIVYQTDGDEGVYVNTNGGWRQMQLI